MILPLLSFAVTVSMTSCEATEMVATGFWSGVLFCPVICAYAANGPASSAAPASSAIFDGARFRGRIALVPHPKCDGDAAHPIGQGSGSELRAAHGGGPLRKRNVVQHIVRVNLGGQVIAIMQAEATLHRAVEAELAGAGDEVALRRSPLVGGGNTKGIRVQVGASAGGRGAERVDCAAVIVGPDDPGVRRAGHRSVIDRSFRLSAGQVDVGQHRPLLVDGAAPAAHQRMSAQANAGGVLQLQTKR